MAQNKKGLGSGLEAIFGENVSEVLEQIQSNSTSEEYGKKMVLPINEIKENPYQPRKTFDKQTLQELADSISVHGVFTPILVRKTISGYQLIAGERRLKASKLANKTEIPAIVMEFDETQMMEISLLENIQRENLNVVEEAYAYQKLIETNGYTQEQLATRVGKSREHIANITRLLKLPKAVLKLVEEDKISMGHARCLITLPTDEKMIEIANRIVNENLSVRQTEVLTNLSKLPKNTKKKEKDPQTRDIERQLTRKLQTKVTVKNNCLQIAYKDISDLNRILEQLGLLED